MLRRWCFIAIQNFKLKNIMRCVLWKRQIPLWIVTLLFGTIQCWFCLFHSSHLVMCFNLKFCVAIEHHPLNIPHFFQFFWNFKTSFSRGFHWFPPNVGFRMIFSPCCARDLSRAFWLARTQTLRIIRLHCWILFDRTTILIPFDNTCTCFQIAPPKKIVFK